MRRQIVLDTETTGLDPHAGHRIVEIGCVEIINLVPSGRTFQQYINPERDMPSDAEQVHGLSIDFLKSYPVFLDIVDNFLNFIGDAELVIHNAPFDMKFLDAELTWIARPLIERHRVIDTLTIAREKFPGKKASLDALCRRFDVDNTKREKHGALLDAELLAEVYLNLMGGRQPSLSFETLSNGLMDNPLMIHRPVDVRPPRDFPLDTGDVDRHRSFIKKHIKNSLWARWTAF